MRRKALPIASKQEFSLPIRDFFNSIDPFQTSGR